MSNNRPTENIIARLERVDGKLEELLAHQTLSKDKVAWSEPLTST